jgi:hypothetical protein
MKQFEIITEADAACSTSARRSRCEGRTCHSARRRHAEGAPVTVVATTAGSRRRRLAPVSDIRRLAIGSDHGGLR